MTRLLGKTDTTLQIFDSDQGFLGASLKPDCLHTVDRCIQKILSQPHPFIVPAHVLVALGQLQIPLVLQRIRLSSQGFRSPFACLIVFGLFVFFVALFGPAAQNSFVGLILGRYIENFLLQVDLGFSQIKHSFLCYLIPLFECRYLLLLLLTQASEVMLVEQGIRQSLREFFNLHVASLKVLSRPGVEGVLNGEFLRLDLKLMLFLLRTQRLVMQKRLKTLVTQVPDPQLDHADGLIEPVDPFIDSVSLFGSVAVPHPQISQEPILPVSLQLSTESSKHVIAGFPHVELQLLEEYCINEALRTLCNAILFQECLQLETDQFLGRSPSTEILMGRAVDPLCQTQYFLDEVAAGLNRHHLTTSLQSRISSNKDHWLFWLSRLTSIIPLANKDTLIDGLPIGNYLLIIDKPMSLESLQSPEQITLKHDINGLLTKFNRLDEAGTGAITKSQFLQFLTLIKVDSINSQSTELIAHPHTQISSHRVFNNNQQFDFETVLSLLGAMQVPQEPSAYVIAFVKILGKYRNKCIGKDGTETTSWGQAAGRGLMEAKEIDEKIRKIIREELRRQKQRMMHEHHKIYQEMERTQAKQFHSFESEWHKYLQEFRQQSHHKYNQIRAKNVAELSLQSRKMEQSAKKHHLLTSPKLQQLYEKKKWLVKESRYADAIRISQHIDREKKKIEEHNETSVDFSLRKRMSSLKRKKQSSMSYVESEMKNNLGRLISKKKEGENLMRIRMRNLQEEANRKLNDHMRSELSKLQAILNRAARSS